MNDDLDPTNDALDRLETEATLIAARSTYETGNRRGLLWIHAFIGLWAGVQMLLWGSAPTIETNLGVWSRVLMAILGFTGGLFLAAGLTRRPRSIPLEVAGLVLVGLWDALMTAGLIYARINQGDFSIIPLGAPLPPGYASAYPITVYAGLFGLILVHLWTLRKLDFVIRKGGHRRP